MEFVLSSLLGILFGILVGLLPGFGLTTCMLLLLPFLINQSLVFCIIFYCTICTVSPYFGNITTLMFKVPGETTSLPLLEILKNNVEQHNSKDLYFMCSLGSFFAFTVSIFLLFIFFFFFTNFSLYLKTYVTFLFCVFGIVLSIFSSQNQKVFSLFLFVLGWYASKVGYDSISQKSFMTFDNIYLYGGIPTFPIIVGLFGIPSLVVMFFHLKNTSNIESLCEEKQSRLELFYRNKKTIIISTFVGFFSGLIPYVGNTISSYFSYVVDKKINGHNLYSNVLSSETANNASNVSVLIPLLFFGIAIVPSEFVLLEILPMANTGLNFSVVEKYFYVIFLFLFLSNFFCFFVSWKLVIPLTKFISYLKFTFPLLICVVLFSGVYYIGSRYEQAIYYVMVLAASSIFGLMLKNKDLLPFVYAFMLQNNFEQIIYRTIKLYL